LDTVDGAERESRRVNKYVVEITLPDGRVRKISASDMKVTAWDSTTNRIRLESGFWWKPMSPVFYEKESYKGNWKRVEQGPEALGNPPIQVAVAEGINRPPTVVASDPATKRNSVLLDLNPGFERLKFGNVEAIEWKATDGHLVRGGLFFPPGFISGERYPLVIQTHGFDPDHFYMDGPWSGAFCARPLAANGFVVLQVGSSPDHEEDGKYAQTPQEAPREMAGYEGAIEYLDNKDIIDRTRVGIIGFSRTVYTVTYTLTHSKYRFAAATIADGVDGSYFQYLAFGLGDYVLVNGGEPSGPTLKLWMQHAPGFNLDKVRTPLRIEAYGPWAILEGWECYAGLSHMNKPVDFIYLPDAQHLLVKPWEQRLSQQGNVDWFMFWMLGKNRISPDAAAQYLRWNALRRLGNEEKAEDTSQ
jgi:hypothetical protein